MDSVAALCVDAQWAELIERRRGNADIFDIISIRETQHSDMLAWLFDARQGHGQNDSIFRDFLLAVHASGSRESSGDRISGKGLTREFICQWPPARVMTTSFASAMFFREYRLPGSDGAGDCKLDLLVVDPDNKFIIAIENKAGARLTKEQLGRYVTRLRHSRLNRGVFAEFDIAFVALDRDHDDDPDADGCDGRWALLSYSWLERAARRAELAEQRGNRDAAIVLSYSRQQFDYEAPNTREISKLARALAMRHAEAVVAIREAKRTFSDPATWTTSKLDAQGKHGQVLRLLLQNRVACDELLDLTRIDMLHGAVIDSAKSTELEADDRMDMKRTYVAYRPRHEVPSVNDHWPLFVNATVESTGIRVCTRWHPKLVPEDQREFYAVSLEKGFGRKNLVNKGGALMEFSFSKIEDASEAILDMVRRCDELLETAASK
jgi:RecB family endonuclease NucS